jgi:hypothetical protein
LPTSNYWWLDCLHANGAKGCRQIFCYGLADEKIIQEERIMAEKLAIDRNRSAVLVMDYQVAIVAGFATNQERRQAFDHGGPPTRVVRLTAASATR